MTDAVSFHLPTKPYNLIAAINRCAAATGSFGYAMAASGADYNGHYNTVYFNDHRNYYVGDYTWGGRHVFTRTTDVLAAVRAGIEEYKRQGLGAYLNIAVKPEDAEAVREAFPELLDGKEEQLGDWYTWRHKEVGSALRSHIDHLLMRADDPDHYNRLQGLVPTERGGLTMDRKVAAEEWAKVRDRSPYL